MASPTRKPPRMADEAGISEEHNVTHVTEDNEARCWGCGLLLLLPSNAPIFKCGWCGALMNQNIWKDDNKWFRWRRFRDRCFVSILVVFMLFVICGGVWAVYPILFSISYFCGAFHSIITVILAVTTISSFSIAAFRIAGPPPNIIWGSYPNVGKGELENYTFCHYCSKPKSPRTHHCRSCGMCTLDMDHHCPFIGNCVGAANHRPFVLFLISTVISTMYVSIMSAYAGLHIWPDLPLEEGFAKFNGIGTNMALRLVKDVIFALLRSTALLSMRGLLLVYLFVSSASVQIGLGVLLWQQLCFIYEGKTYLSNLSSQNRDGVRDCQNFSRFFGCSWPPYLEVRCFPNFRKKLK